MDDVTTWIHYALDSHVRLSRKSPFESLEARLTEYARQDADAPKASPDSHGQAYTQSNEGKGPEWIKRSFYWYHRQQFNPRDYLGAKHWHQWPTTRWLSQFDKGRDYWIVRQLTEPSDRAQSSSKKWEMSVCHLSEWDPHVSTKWSGYLSAEASLSYSSTHLYHSLSLSR
jgi:hypothetical protein